MTHRSMSNTGTTRAVRFHQAGGVEVLQTEIIPLPPPAPGEVQIRHRAIGVNFIDTYHRSGLYPLPLPSGLGQEGAGEITAIGEGVQGFAIGDRVAYAGGAPGSYSEARNLDAAHVVPLPADIPFDTAAASMLAGLTAEYLLHRTYRVQPGDTLLIHAAAGGVGSLACQWAQALGATVIGTAGGPEKCRLAQQWCHHVIDYKSENFTDRVRQLTQGAGVAAVYDSIGHDTFAASLACLRPFGLLVSYGNATGPVTGVNLGDLAANSLYVTRPLLFTHTRHRPTLLEMAGRLFTALRDGTLRPQIGLTAPLADAACVHIALQARQTSGACILHP